MLLDDYGLIGDLESASLVGSQWSASSSRRCYRPRTRTPPALAPRLDLEGG
jgi:hypothetical protein